MSAPSRVHLIPDCSRRLPTICLHDPSTIFEPTCWPCARNSADAPLVGLELPGVLSCVLAMRPSATRVATSPFWQPALRSARRASAHSRSWRGCREQLRGYLPQLLGGLEGIHDLDRLRVGLRRQRSDPLGVRRPKWFGAAPGRIRAARPRAGGGGRPPAGRDRVSPPAAGAGEAALRSARGAAALRKDLAAGKGLTSQWLCQDYREQRPTGTPGVEDEAGHGQATGVQGGERLFVD